MPVFESLETVARPMSASVVAGSGAQPSLRLLARRNPPVVPPETVLRDALYQISQRREDAAVVADPASGLPLGLVTLWDLLHIISFEGGGLDDPVVAHMVGAPLALPADAPAHRARVLMTRRGTRYLLVVDGDGRLCGLIDKADLLGLRAGGAEALIEAIAAARDLDTMTRVADQVRRRGVELFRGGLGIESLCHWMSTLNDLIVMRVIELMEDEFELPAVPWCWLVFGSEGRLEMTFSTDQDNGLLFVPPEPAATESLRAAFLPFARAVNEALHHCGFERCRGNIMASNPSLCLSAEEWRRAFAGWLAEPDPKALVNGTIFFDFRPLYGAFEPADALHGWLMAQTPQASRFLRNLAELAVGVAPPLGWAGQFSYDRHPDFPHSIDLKLQGARLFVDAARLWALQHGIPTSNTPERLRALDGIEGAAGSDTAADIEAFQLIQRFRIARQLESLAAPAGSDLANRLDPDDLNELHRLMLKDALKVAKRMQSRLQRHLGPALFH